MPLPPPPHRTAMSRSLAKILAILAVIIPAPVYAPTRWNVIELGAFGRYGDFTTTTMGLTTPRATWRVSGCSCPERRCSRPMELWFQRRRVASTWDHKPFHVRLIGNLPIGKRLAFLLGGGWAYNSFSKGITETENGVGGIDGVAGESCEAPSVRGEVIADYMFDQASSVANPTFHYAAQVGVSLMLFGGPGDKDKDGVKDNVDRCPDTPAGTRGRSHRVPRCGRRRCGRSGRPVCEHRLGPRLTRSGAPTPTATESWIPQDRCPEHTCRHAGGCDRLPAGRRQGRCA